MARRRGLWLAVAIGAGVVLLVLGRPGGDASSTDPAGSVNGAEGAPAPAAPTPGVPGQVPPTVGTTATSGSAPTVTPAPSPVLPHPESGVVGDESLDPAGARAAVATAEEFAAAWATPGPDWHDRLVDLATPALAGALADAQPPQPAPVLSDDGRLLFDTLAWARVAVPTDRGVLVLDLVATTDQWLVTSVDWRPA